MKTARPCHAPTSSYRLQFHHAFTFRDATRVVPYLARLGVNDCYSSPYLMARAGSQHGYDISDHTRLNPEVGSEQEYGEFVAALQTAGMGQTLDFVPNHMGIDPATNAWWRDVLENGPSSVYGRFFDIDWYPLKPELETKVLLPILGDQYGHVLERGELRLGYRTGTLTLAYFGNVLPINPRGAVGVYRYGLEELREQQGEDKPHLREFLSILTALSNLPAYEETSPERIVERHREKEVARDRLAHLVDRSPMIRRHVERALEAFNGVRGQPQSFDLLHGLLEAQPYRLSYWRTAAHEINYRRFFDINALAGIRMEDPEVFAATHVLVERLIAGGQITGLRLDHPDGLFDPREYLERLQALAARARGGASASPFHVIVEKILSADEQLPMDWPVSGTTGYNFLNDLNGLFVDQSKVQALRRIYRRIQGDAVRFEEVAYRCKKLIAETALASELNVLAHALNRIAEGNRRSRDFTLYSLRGALEEVVACFPVYRTYVSPSGWSASDREVIETAINRARQRNPAVDASIFDFILEALLPRQPADEQSPGDGAVPDRRTAYLPPDHGQYHERLQFSMRFQQYTSPVQAKGLEDTAFYRYNLLLSLNEVGGDPARVGLAPSAFHEANRRRLACWPLETTATATHDTKLGEDVRARINVLSELPDEWRRGLSRWMRINASNRRPVDGALAPDRNDEYRFYQVLLGALPPRPEDPAVSPGRQAPSVGPVDREIVRRMREYMLKAIKEAKLHTSWINENKAYDEAVTSFVELALTGPTSARFLAAFLPFAQRVARLGMVNSLAQMVLKMASPGVPDVYQGTELWDLSLVDPDNRTPVDFARREAMLTDLEGLLDGTDPTRDPPDSFAQRRGVTNLLAAWQDARIKMFVLAVSLRLRRRHPDVFLDGDYVPLVCEMAAPAELVAFARCRGARAVVAVVPRFTARFGDDGMPVGSRWGDSKVLVPGALRTGRYRSLLTGEILTPSFEDDRASLAARDVLATCPVALLWHEPDISQA